MQCGEGICGGDDATGPGQAQDSDSATLRFVEIRGLYRPGHDDSGERGDGRSIRSGYEVGYTSEDDRGRIFINHRPRASASEGWQAARAKDTQYIELIVEISDPSGSLPADARVRWNWEDPDDPSDAGMRPQAARVTDSRASGGDNRGKCDFPTVDASDEPCFEAVAGFPLSGQGACERETAIVGSESKVRLHCTNVGGDNFVVRAEIAGPGQTPVSTGVMTLWKRIDVECHQQRGARDLPYDRIAEAFEDAHIQLDFDEPATTFDIHRSGAPVRTRYMTRQSRIHAPARALTRRLFRNAGRPGWFLLVAADLETSQAAADAPILYPPQPAGGGPAQSGPATLHTVETHDRNGMQLYDWVIVNQPLADDVTAVYIKEGSHTLTLYPETDARRLRAHRPSLAPGQDAVLLRPMHYTTEPAVGHGDYDVAYSRYWAMMMDLCVSSDGRRDRGGFGFTGTIEVILEGGYSIGAAGITPLFSHRVGARARWFAGRSIVFTGKFDQDPAVYEEQCLRTAIHELCHAFGMPHGCGNFAARGSGSESCAMHNLNYWLIDPRTVRAGRYPRLLRWNSGTKVPRFCAGHLLGLRLTHLEQNPALWNWP